MKERFLAILIVGLAVVAVGSVGVAQQQGNSGAFVIIVHPDNTASSMTRAEASDLLLKKTTRWPNGTAVKPMDLAGSSPIREAFSQAIHGRSVDRVKNYWQRKIFSGRDVPPPEADTGAAVVTHVAAEEGSIGYVAAGTAMRAVKAITLSD